MLGIGPIEPISLGGGRTGQFTEPGAFRSRRLVVPEPPDQPVGSASATPIFTAFAVPWRSLESNPMTNARLDDWNEFAVRIPGTS